VSGARAVLAAALVAKTSVEEQQKFHDARQHWAEDNLKPLADAYNQAVGAEAALSAQVTAATDALAAAKDACKVQAFDLAQAARVEAAAVAEARKVKIAEVADKYLATAKFPTDGSAGTLCNKPKVAAGAAAQPRKTCADGEPGKPLCCGAAQRFLKDGTKLTIETCQLATDTTYKYYPALPKDALVAPPPETWRFQCISAAQKLAAAAAAALAAGYMMA